ncbi:MAG: hypothetical protein ACP5KV_07645 [Candidatus Methanomethylicaceae archaeon]
MCSGPNAGIRLQTELGGKAPAKGVLNIGCLRGEGNVNWAVVLKSPIADSRGAVKR